MPWETQDRVRRTVILIQMESGMEHAYEVTGPNVTITHEPDEWTTFRDMPYTYIPGPHYGTLTASGVLRGLVQWGDAFEPKAIEPVRPELMP
jgi:hypothetical protein